MNVEELLSNLPESSRAKLQETDQPEWLEPMLATLTDERFSDPEWIYERKLDGERCITYRDGDSVRLMSRNQKNLNVHYPDLRAALERTEPTQFIVDGEVVAFKDNVTSFARLQQRMHIQDLAEAKRSDVTVYYYIFDVLHLGQYETMQLPLRERKSLLKRTFDFDDPLRYTIHRNEMGGSYFDEACQRGWEGIIAKNAVSSYIHGRSRKWLKFKCVSQQEFVVGGYTEPQGERIGFGALLLGYYERQALRYAGKVGTGFDDETLRRLYRILNSLERETSPFAMEDVPDGEVHWVTPQMVVEIGFEEWTQSGKLRQPRYLGQRSDKEASKVVKERAKG